MTCASCAMRIDKKLNKIDGVEATVNYATEKATVRVGEQTTPALLIQTIEQAGYAATLPADTERNPELELGRLGRRVITAATLSVPVIIRSMITGSSSPTGSGSLSG